MGLMKIIRCFLLKRKTASSFREVEKVIDSKDFYALFIVIEEAIIGIRLRPVVKFQKAD